MYARILALLTFGLVFGGLLCGSSARADSWELYGRRIFADPAGRYYVVVTEINPGRHASFAFAQAKASSPPVRASQSDTYGPEPKGSGVRPGDVVLATGMLKTAPIVVLVSPAGSGFAGMEEYGGVGFGNAFVWVTRAGKALHVKRMQELFEFAEIQTFSHSTSSIYWFRDAWLEEASGQVVVVGNGEGGLLKIVSLSTGRVRAGGETEIRRAIRGTDRRVQIVALELALERRLGGLEKAMRALLEDNAATLGVQLRAALLLARGGDYRGAALVRSACEGGVPTDEQGLADYRYGVAHLGELLGEKALPLLQGLMRGPAGEAWIPAKEAFVSLAGVAVPTLIAMLEEVGESSDYRGGAAHALGAIGSKGVLAPLLRTVTDSDEYVANAALNAAIEAGDETIAKELVALLDRSTTQDGRLASYFGQGVKEAASIAPLVRCLARHPEDEYPRSAILEALQFQTGERLGDSTAAWQRWLKRWLERRR